MHVGQTVRLKTVAELLRRGWAQDDIGRLHPPAISAHISVTVETSMVPLLGSTVVITAAHHSYFYAAGWAWDLRIATSTGIVRNLPAWF